MPFDPENAVLCYCETNAKLYFISLLGVASARDLPHFHSSQKDSFTLH